MLINEVIKQIKAEESFESLEKELEYVEHRLKYIFTMRTSGVSQLTKFLEDKGLIETDWNTVHNNSNPEEKWVEVRSADGRDFFGYAKAGSNFERAKKYANAFGAEQEQQYHEAKKLETRKKKIIRELAALNYKKGATQNRVLPHDIPKTLSLADWNLSAVANPYYAFGDGEDVERYAGPPENFDWSEYREYALEYTKINQALQHAGLDPFQVMFSAKKGNEFKFALCGGFKNQIILENNSQFPTALLHIQTRMKNAHKWIDQSDIAMVTDIKAIQRENPKKKP